MAEAVPTEDHLECRTAEVMEDFKRNAQNPENSNKIYKHNISRKRNEVRLWD